MDFETSVNRAIYQSFVHRGAAPTVDEVAARLEVDRGAVAEAYRSLASQRVLVLQDDGESIRMALPFSGIPTQHQVEVEGRHYFANCAWDALGIPAALHQTGVVTSRCEQSREPLRLEVGLDGPEPSPWLFHCLVPAAKWWDDVVFT
ncbi:MAG: hypothetical protein K0U98_05285 [Deltaproteobacteria bacterium]|nr:hypothetical protein [Deltaproteobacteria bacterium]